MPDKEQFQEKEQQEIYDSCDNTIDQLFSFHLFTPFSISGIMRTLSRSISL